MIYAKSKTEYDLCYRELQQLRSNELKQYFDQNWHNIQEQWVGYLVNNFKNYANRTNNRLESLNQKIKSVVTKYGNLGSFFDDLITLTASYNIERDHDAAMHLMKTPLTGPLNTEHDLEYSEYLTAFAFGKYKAQSIMSAEIQLTRLNATSAECLHQNAVVHVTMSNCSCLILAFLVGECCIKYIKSVLVFSINSFQ